MDKPGTALLKSYIRPYLSDEDNLNEIMIKQDRCQWNINYYKAKRYTLEQDWIILQERIGSNGTGSK